MSRAASTSDDPIEAMEDAQIPTPVIEVDSSEPTKEQEETLQGVWTDPEVDVKRAASEDAAAWQALRNKNDQKSRDKKVPKSKAAPSGANDRRRRAAEDPYQGEEEEHGDGGTGSPTGRRFPAEELLEGKDESEKLASPKKKAKKKFLNGEVSMGGDEEDSCDDDSFAKIMKDFNEMGRKSSEEEDDTVEVTQPFAQPAPFAETFQDGITTPVPADGAADGADAGLPGQGGARGEGVATPVDLHANMMMGFMEQLQTKFGRMEEILISTTSTLTKELRDSNKALDNRIDETQKQIQQGLKEQDEKYVRLNSKLDKQATSVHEKIARLAERMEAIEKGKSDAPSRATSSPSPARTPPPTRPHEPLQHDAWANYLQNRTTPAPALSPASVTRPTSSPEPDRDFTPGAVFLKGWCRFKDPVKSLTHDEALELGAKVMKLIENSSAKQYVRDIQTPNLQNSRLVINVERGTSEGTSHAMKVRNAITAKLRAAPLLVHDAPIFAMVEPAPEKRARNACIAKANAALEQCLGEEDIKHIKLDVRAGACYYSPNPLSDKGLIEVGAFSSTRRTWIWRPAALASSWPELNADELERATAALLQE